jgi:hypothetical protein
MCMLYSIEPWSVRSVISSIDTFYQWSVAARTWYVDGLGSKSSVTRRRSFQNMIFSKFTRICKIFLQICVKFLTNYWKINCTNICMNICKPNLAYFTSTLQKMAQNDCKKTCPTKLYWIKVTKIVKCMYRLQICICNYKYL